MREFISEFDYLDDYIHFYSDTPFLYRPSFSNDNINVTKITIIVLMIGFMNIFLSKVKLNNNNIYK